MTIKKDKNYNNKIKKQFVKNSNKHNNDNKKSK